MYEVKNKSVWQKLNEAATRYHAVPLRKNVTKMIAAMVRRKTMIAILCDLVMKLSTFLDGIFESEQLQRTDEERFANAPS